MLKQKQRQSGAVSLFVVVFATLLITIVTVSFTRIMVQHQQQANAADLSQSAYDSAKNGVEDGKRMIAYVQNYCNTKTLAECQTLKAAVASTCNSNLGNIGIVIDSTTKEVKLQTDGSSSNNLDQAYTCLKIAFNTNSYLGELTKDESKFISLKGAGQYNTVKIEWFTKDNLSGGSKTATLSSVSDTPLLSQSSWGNGTPPMMRTQFIKFNSTAGFTLSQLDSAAFNRTAFLYPSGTAPGTSVNLEGARMTGTIKPDRVRCNADLAVNTYSCTAEISMGGTVQTTDLNYLRLSAIYNNAKYKISLLMNGSVVDFDGVQPEVDSTGRANTLFRRVKSRVELSDVSFPYPEAAVDTTGNFCKDFIITDSESEYVNNCAMN